MSALPENMKRLRKAQHLTQEQAAKEIGMAFRSYRRYESGEREPDVSTLIQIADYYHISLDELAGHTIS